MSAAAVWMVAGLVLAALEMVVPGVFLLWVGLAAFGAGAAAAALALGSQEQVIGFLVLAVTLVGMAALRLKQRPRAALVNVPAGGLIGQTCRAMAFRDGEGRVSLGDGTWLARVQGGASPEIGQALTVVGLDGTTLLVQT